MIPEPLGIGSLRVDELIVPITDIRFRPRRIEIEAWVKGPSSPVSGYIRLMNEQGEAITDSVEGNSSWIDLPRLDPGDTCHFVYNLKMDTIKSDKSPVIADYR